MVTSQNALPSKENTLPACPFSPHLFCWIPCPTLCESRSPLAPLPSFLLFEQARSCSAPQLKFASRRMLLPPPAHFLLKPELCLTGLQISVIEKELHLCKDFP